MVPKFFLVSLFSSLIFNLPCLADVDDVDTTTVATRHRQAHIRIEGDSIFVNSVDSNTFPDLIAILESDTPIRSLSLHSCNLRENDIPLLQQTLDLFTGNSVDLRNNNLGDSAARLAGVLRIFS